MRDADRMQSPLELGGPEAEKAATQRKARRQIVIMPDATLQKHWMSRQAVKVFSHRQAVSGKLPEENLGIHFFSRASEKGVPEGGRPWDTLKFTWITIHIR